VTPEGAMGIIGVQPAGTLAAGGEEGLLSPGSAKVAPEGHEAEDVEEDAEELPTSELYKFVTSSRFDHFIMGVVLLNTVIMASAFEGMPEFLVITYKYLNWMFTAMFAIEAVLKLWAMGPCLYWKSRWNRFDLIVLCTSGLGIAAEIVGQEIGLSPGILRVLRMARVARLLKMSNNLLGVRALLVTIYHALQEVGNVFILVALFFFVYSALGVELFGRIGCSRSMCVGFDNDHSGFTNFGQAFFTLLRLVTVDNASAMVIDATRRPPYCDDSPECKTDCCSMFLMPELFFVTFYMGSRFVLFNFVVAILIEQLRLAHQGQLVEEIEAQQAELEELDEDELLARLGLDVDLGERDENALGTSKVMQAKMAADAAKEKEENSRWHVAASDKYVKGKSPASGTKVGDDEVPLSVPAVSGPPSKQPPSRAGTAGVTAPRLGGPANAAQTRPLTGFAPPKSPPKSPSKSRR